MAKLWESSIRQALMPVVHVTGPQGSVSSVKASGEASSDKPSNSTSGTAAANVAGSTKAAAETDNRQVDRSTYGYVYKNVWQQIQ